MRQYPKIQTLMKTIFEKIIDREIPADIIYEDDISIAFLDINPVRKGHMLVISKFPYPWVTDVPEELIGKLFIRAQKIAKSMKKALKCDLIQIVVDGKEVPHFHIHLIPRLVTDSGTDFSHTSYETDSEKQNFIDIIKSSL